MRQDDILKATLVAMTKNGSYVEVAWRVGIGDALTSGGYPAYLEIKHATLYPNGSVRFNWFDGLDVLLRLLGVPKHDYARYRGSGRNHPIFVVAYKRGALRLQHFYF